MGLGKRKKKQRQEDEEIGVQPSAPPMSTAYIVPLQYFLYPQLPDQQQEFTPAYAPPPVAPEPPQPIVPETEPNEDDAEKERKRDKRHKKKVKQKGRNTCIPKEIKAMVALVTLILAVFDIYADGSAASVFVKEEFSYLAWSMVCILFIASVLFFLQIYAFYLRVRSLCEVRSKTKQHEELDAELLHRENRYLCCAESTGYLLLVLEDAPLSGILVLVTFMPVLDFGNGVNYCNLYIALFESSYVGWLALLASLIAALWKFLLSFFYASACCCMEWGGIEGHCLRGCCCFFRVVRPILAFFMVGCAFYIYYFYRHGMLVAQIQCTIPK